MSLPSDRVYCRMKMHGHRFRCYGYLRTFKDGSRFIDFTHREISMLPEGTVLSFDASRLPIDRHEDKDADWQCPGELDADHLLAGRERLPAGERTIKPRPPEASRPF